MALSMSSSFTMCWANTRMPSASFSVAMASSLRSHLNLLSSIPLRDEARAWASASLAAASASRRTVTGSFSFASSSRSLGEMVSLSQPARERISEVLRKEAPITTVSYPPALYTLKMFFTEITPGSSSPTKSFPVFFLCQSRMRPTKGEMRVAPASAAATACARQKSRVMLHVIPSFSKISAARMPSHVVAILISTLSFPTPISSYMPIISRA
mmetsp:Transcript_22744/g.57934  ORF Transcript_22744/g.57934 Transcript_22744/m.57934 type:complete len:213 (-) Transcript_22744:339-977(-)